MNYQGYFIYKGIAYGKGTTVLFSEKVHTKYHFSPILKEKPHEFVGGSSDGWMNFRWKEGDDWRYDAHSEVTVCNLEEEIIKIINPVYVELVPWQTQAVNNIINRAVCPDIFGGVLMYIITMLVGMIFNDRLIIWVCATIIFGIWLLNQYRT